MWSESGLRENRGQRNHQLEREAELTNAQLGSHLVACEFAKPDEERRSKYYPPEENFLKFDPRAIKVRSTYDKASVL